MKFHNAKQETFVKQKLQKMSIIDTGGLPYEIIPITGKYYILTTNINVVDSLAHDAAGKFCHLCI